MKITPGYIVGLVDGEGCFEIALGRNPGYRSGFQLRPEFHITVTQGESRILERIRRFLGLGNIYSYYAYKRRDSCKRVVEPDRLTVVGLDDLKKVRRFFQKHTPNVRFKAFQIWSRAIDVAEEMRGLEGSKEKEKFLELARLREQLREHLGGHPRKYSYEDIRKEVEKKFAAETPRHLKRWTR